MKFLVLALLLLATAALLFYFALRQHKKSGLPMGEVVYADTSAWQTLAEPYYDSHLHLAGKPDYVIKQGYTSIPVEVKTGRTPPAPYDSHIMQLASYCVLIDRATGLRPPYGVLHYPEKTYQVAFTPELEQALLDLLTDIRAKEKHKKGVNRSHQSEARCRRCGFRKVCDQRLG